MGSVKKQIQESIRVPLLGNAAVARRGVNNQAAVKDQIRHIKTPTALGNILKLGLGFWPWQIHLEGALQLLQVFFN